MLDITGPIRYNRFYVIISIWLQEHVIWSWDRFVNTALNLPSKEKPLLSRLHNDKESGGLIVEGTMSSGGFCAGRKTNCGAFVPTHGVLELVLG